MNERLDPFIVDHQFFQEAQKELQLCYDSFGRTPDPRCTPILGPSGSGKSTMVKDYIASLVGGSPTEKLVIYIETPSYPSARGFASKVLNAIGDPMYDRGTVVQMTVRIVDLLEKLGTRLLIFDEFHNLVDKESAKLSYAASDWLKGLINEAKIPTVIVGLERCREIFIINEQLQRRFTEAYVMEPFYWKRTETQNMLKGFLKALQQRYTFAAGLEIHEHEVAFRFYCATGGLVGYIMSIVREAARLATVDSVPITMDHLATGYLTAVCNNRLVKINPFTDQNSSRIEAALSVVEGSQKAGERKSRKQHRPR
ncbi:TniB family NTP-binding protein [Pelotalea chapellei]|uniref:ATP-binding protein n=1 Tax=Pelotalea chapellei TaxID=44671 RepID=A0ABS5U4W1_9BACT|nr:TniB family NTP-binding protein [Pelotalea chapellei]MBT1070690.1 ATP-binding protein [Pelotalea chapellei]